MSRPQCGISLPQYLPALPAAPVSPSVGKSDSSGNGEGEEGKLGWSGLCRDADCLDGIAWEGKSMT